jgi:opacity protein-like surface antigen
MRMLATLFLEVTVGELSFDNGLGLTGGIGHAYGNGFRTEIELGYRLNDLDEIRGKGVFAGFGSAPLNGDISSLSLMVNGYYDIDLGASVTPFIGGGLGFARVALDSSDFGIDDNDTVFAYQFAAGVSFALNPKLNLDLQYRLFGTSDPDFTDDFGDRIETEYTTHTLDGWASL